MAIPGVDDGRDLARSCRRTDLSCESRANEENITLPLTGVRVLEIGQYTTAPLTARHLASLGAEVIKIEPPSGDAAREWAPKVDGLSVFFAMSNSGKTSYCLDLKTEFGRDAFAELVATADVMVENMKPGSLAAIGFTAARLQEINPKLIYCAITGFGSDSVYENRPAFRYGCSGYVRYDGCQRLEWYPLEGRRISMRFPWGAKLPCFRFLPPCTRERRQAVVSSWTCLCRTFQYG